MKIHFVGYGNEYVGWRDLVIDSDQLPFFRLKKNYVPDVESFEDRKQMFHDNLYRAIKRKLWSGRIVRIVRIELQLDRMCLTLDWVIFIPNCTFLVRFGGISAEFGRVKIPMARPNEPKIQPKN